MFIFGHGGSDSNGVFIFRLFVGRFHKLARFICDFYNFIFILLQIEVKKLIHRNTEVACQFRRESNVGKCNVVFPFAYFLKGNTNVLIHNYAS